MAHLLARAGAGATQTTATKRPGESQGPPNGCHCLATGSGSSKQAALQMGVEVSAGDGLAGPPILRQAGAAKLKQAKHIVDNKQTTGMGIVLAMCRPNHLPRPVRCGGEGGGSSLNGVAQVGREGAHHSIMHIHVTAIGRGQGVQHMQAARGEAGHNQHPVRGRDMPGHGKQVRQGLRSAANRQAGQAASLLRHGIVG